VLAQDGKPSMKGVWSGHVNHLNFGGHQLYLRTDEARVVNFCMHVSYVKSQHKDDRSPLKRA